MSEPKRYPIAYRVEPVSHTKAELQAKDMGGTDAIVLVSIMREHLDRPHQGTKSIAILTKDGATGGEIPTTELFQVFAHMAHALKDAPGLREWQRDIVTLVIEAVRSVMLAKPRH